MLKVHPAGKTADNLLVPEDFPSDQMPACIAPQFTKPIFLIVGNEDERTPRWMAEKIYRALPDSICKRLSVYEQAGHGGMEAPYFVDMKRWMEETMAFMTGIR